jgi:hypothetical protein
MQFFLSHVNGYDDIVDQRPHLIRREAEHVLAHQLYQKTPSRPYSIGLGSGVNPYSGLLWNRLSCFRMWKS